MMLKGEIDLDMFLTKSISSPFKEVVSKFESIRIWDFSWINLLRIKEPLSFDEKPVYVNEKNKLIFEPEKMFTEKYYEIEWDDVKLLLRKEKDGGIAFYEILKESILEKIQKKLLSSNDK